MVGPPPADRWAAFSVFLGEGTLSQKRKAGMLKSMLRKLDWLLGKIAFVSVALGAVMTVFMMCASGYGVCVRYFTGRPKPMFYEIAVMSMFWVFHFLISFMIWKRFKCARA
jgi:hypothetical protein